MAAIKHAKIVGVVKMHVITQPSNSMVIVSPTSRYTQVAMINVGGVRDAYWIFAVGGNLVIYWILGKPNMFEFQTLQLDKMRVMLYKMYVQEVGCYHPQHVKMHIKRITN